MIRVMLNDMGLPCKTVKQAEEMIEQLIIEGWDPEEIRIKDEEEE